MLDLVDVVDAVLAHNRDLQTAQLRLEQADAGYWAARAARGSQVELELEPYSIDRRRAPELGGSAGGFEQGGFSLSPDTEAGGDSGGGFGEFEFAEPRTTLTHGAAANLRYGTALDTGGRISGELGTRATASRTLGENDEDDELSYQLAPTLSLRLTQPIFSDGRFIDTRVEGARDTRTALAARNARVAREELESSLVLAGLELYFAIGDLRERIETMELRIDLSERQIREVSEDVEAGTATERALLQLRVAKNQQEGALLDLRNRLRELERRFNRLTGGALPPGDYRFAPDLVPAGGEAHAGLDGIIEASRYAELRRRPEEEWDVSRNADVTRSDLHLEEARADLIVSGVDRAPEFAALSTISRRYPDERAEADSPGTAVTDLFDGDGGFDWSVSLSLTFQLFDGGAAREARRADELGVELARREWNEAQQTARDEIADLGARAELLLERADLGEDEVRLERDRLQDIEALFELGDAGSRDVDEARADLAEAEADAAQARVDLFLSVLELEAALGGSLSELVLALATEG